MRTKTNLTANVADGSAPTACGNCEWRGPLDECDEIDDIGGRLDPGSEVPAGQCPKCGCLAYLDRVGDARAVTVTPAGKAHLALLAARNFIAGFDGDELQHGIPELLASIDEAIRLGDALAAAISAAVASFGDAVKNDEPISGADAVDALSTIIRAAGEPEAAPTIVAVHIEGGVFQGLSTNRPEALAGVQFILLDYDEQDQDAPGVFQVKYLDGDASSAGGGVVTVEASSVDLVATLANARAAE